MFGFPDVPKKGKFGFTDVPNIPEFPEFQKFGVAFVFFRRARVSGNVIKVDSSIASENFMKIDCSIARKDHKH